MNVMPRQETMQCLSTIEYTSFFLFERRLCVLALQKRKRHVV